MVRYSNQEPEAQTLAEPAAAQAEPDLEAGPVAVVLGAETAANPTRAATEHRAESSEKAHSNSGSETSFRSELLPKAGRAAPRPHRRRRVHHSGDGRNTPRSLAGPAHSAGDLSRGAKGYQNFYSQRTKLNLIQIFKLSFVIQPTEPRKGKICSEN